MGSLITFGLDKLCLDWAKNFKGEDYSALFTRGDLKDVPYEYDDCTEIEPAYSRKLRNVLPRLELLGYSLAYCEEAYRRLFSAGHYYFEDSKEEMTFVQFLEVIRKLSFSFPEFFPKSQSFSFKDIFRHIEANPDLKVQMDLSGLDIDGNGCVIEMMHPHVGLRLLAENPENLDLDVVWRFNELVANGWAEEEEIFIGLSPSSRILVVTEGSSDSSILEKSLPIVSPDVVDFFYFVDMAEHYPFTGTGNVVRFIQGLSRINVQNRVLVVLDNDTAGRSALEKLSGSNLPSNIRIMILPDLEQCTRVETVGPSGASFEDINGRAVSIEFFLDLSSVNPVVRWLSYDEQLGAYQGAVIGKNEYVRKFHNDFGRCDYDCSRLKLLWDCINAECRLLVAGSRKF